MSRRTNPLYGLKRVTGGKHLIAAALFVVAGVAAVALSSTFGSSRTPGTAEVDYLKPSTSQSLTALPPETTPADTSAPPPATPAEVPGQSPPAPGPAASTGSGGTGTPPPADNSACTLNISDLKKEYLSTLRKKENALEARLDYPIVGSNIIESYIHTFNDEMMRLYEAYLRTAGEHNCAFPVRAPEPYRG